MTRFTKADVDSEAYAQKLNQMLWGRCKAGKINQSEYTALVENRDVNLKRLIAEKNLTLDEARHVRSLVMEYHLTMSIAIDVAKEKITLAQARQKRPERPTASSKASQGTRLQQGRSTRTTAQAKTDPSRSRGAQQKTGRYQKGSPRPQSAEPYASAGNAPSPVEKAETSRRDFQRNSSSGATSQPQRGSNPRSHQNQNQNPRFSRNPKARWNNQKNRPEAGPHSKSPSDNEVSSNQQQSRPENVPDYKNRQDRQQRPNRPGQNFQKNRPGRKFQPSQSPQRRPGFERRAPEKRSPSQPTPAPEVWGSDVDYTRTCREGESAARGWRDWREERNVQIRSKETGKVLPPIPPGQDWYPGMGFRPSESPAPKENPPAKPVESFPKIPSAKPSDFAVEPIHSQKESRDFKESGVVPSTPSSSSESTVHHPIIDHISGGWWKGTAQSQGPNPTGLKPKVQRRVFGKARRFVPRKGSFKHPAN